MSRSLVFAGAALLLAGTGFGLRFVERRRAEEAEARAGALRMELRAQGGRDSGARRALEAEFAGETEALRKRIAALESSGKAREGELAGARGEIERLRRAAEEEARRRAAAEREAALPRPTPEPPAPAVPKPVADPPPTVPRTLGPAAVTDPRQVRKLVDGLNTLLAGVGGTESWRLLSAEAAEDDRLVKVVLEARAADGAVSKSFRAAEGRFVLQAAAGTLSIRLKEGSVTYPGDRTLSFPGGAYTVLLVVDPAPFRASGHPLLSIQ